MLEMLEWLEGTSFGAIARQSLYGFQILVGIHILGIIFSLGTLLWVDLRMVGVCLTRYRLSDVYRTLSPWFVAGFVVMVASGIAIFSGFATSAYENTFFRIKILVMVLAGINALVFHSLLKRIPASAVEASRPPASIRAAGFASIAFWTIVLLCGRMMSYTLF
jgi:hypothetical protein